MRAVIVCSVISTMANKGNGVYESGLDLPNPHRIGPCKHDDEFAGSIKICKSERKSVRI